MTETFDKALSQGKEEYEKLYKLGMRFIKSTPDRISACNMVFMRARDIERESKQDNGHEFCFTISTYDPENEKWLRCPGCGNPEINQLSANGNEWQGCYRCHVLLDKYGKIKSMKSQVPKKEAVSAFIGIAVVFSAFSIGSYVVRDGKSPSQLQDSGAINMSTKEKAKPRVKLEEEPNWNCESYFQWSENDDEDTFWKCRKNLTVKEACPTNCSGFKLKKKATR